MLHLDDTPSDTQRSLLELYLLNEELDVKDVIGMAADMILGGIHTVIFLCLMCFCFYFYIL